MAEELEEMVLSVCDDIEDVIKISGWDINRYEPNSGVCIIDYQNDETRNIAEATLNRVEESSVPWALSRASMNSKGSIMVEIAEWADGVEVQGEVPLVFLPIKGTRYSVCELNLENRDPVEVTEAHAHLGNGVQSVHFHIRADVTDKNGDSFADNLKRFFEQIKDCQEDINKENKD